MVKAGDVNTKANLQSPFYIKDIDFRCLKGHRPSAKKDKKDTYWEPHNKVLNKNKDKTKSHNSSTFANQPQTQAPKKDECGCWGGHPATEINATEVAKKDKDKAPKDLSHVKCYTCHQKGHYTSKCSEKPKN